MAGHEEFAARTRELCRSAGIDLGRAGHWRHEWVPLDPVAAKEKFHGHVPAGWSPPRKAFGKLSAGDKLATTGGVKTVAKVEPVKNGHHRATFGDGSIAVYPSDREVAHVPAEVKPPDRAAKAQQRRLEKARAAKDDAEAAYQKADDAYQAALKASYSPGGGFNPRSPEAQKAESLRQPMLDAKARLGKARMALLALQMSA